MGACNFETIAIGKNPRDAFNRAVSQAQWEHGHGGYTGTIAEKIDFVVIPLPKRTAPFDLANRMMDVGDSRINDKWGPAGCIEIPRHHSKIRKVELRRGEREYLFFGWASS